MSQLERNGSCESFSLEIASSDSGDNSAHNSTTSIPSSITTVTTGSSRNEGDTSPPSNSSSRSALRPKKFSLNLNGHPSPSPGHVTPSSAGSPDRDQPSNTGVHRGDQYSNRDRLALDLSALSSMPELCDVTFLVGGDRQPVCGVRAILAARSKVFRKMLYTDSTLAVGISKRVKKKQQQLYRPADGYIEKYDFRGQPTIIVRDFEPEVFKQLIDYTHTGTVVLQASTLLGLMNASDHYGLEELKQACIRFMEHCITIETVCSLLSSAEKYIQFKSTKILVQKIFEFVDAHAEAILKLRAFLTLPQHVVRIVMTREELAASETTKFEAAYNWCLNNCKGNVEDNAVIKKLFEPFVDVINYSLIPAKFLMQRVKPSGVVDSSYILTALAFQADPHSVPPTSKSPMNRARSVLTPLEDHPKPVALGFRRVQSSSTTFSSVVDSGPTLRRQYEHNQRLRDARAGSVPLNSEADSSSLDVHDSYMFSRGSEVHPLRAHDVKDRMYSQSSSHASILSTPPLSPIHSPSSSHRSPSHQSPSDTSYQGSILSGSSSDCVPALLQDGSSGSGSQTGQTGPAGGNASSKKRLSYNPLALDAIVKLSSNAVEV